MTARINTVVFRAAVMHHVVADTPASLSRLRATRFVLTRVFLATLINPAFALLLSPRIFGKCSIVCMLFSVQAGFMRLTDVGDTLDGGNLNHVMYGYPER